VSTSGIGASVKRREDVRLLTGCGRFADDCDAPGQVHAAFVRSPHAHADVLAIEAGPARAVAGVLGVFTGRDLAADGVGPIPTGIAERAGAIRSRDGSPFAEPPWHPLALDRARHVGEPVALVVAATPAAARDGAEAVRVAYAARPAVVDAVAALAAGAPRLHAGVAGNRAYDWECGDPEAVARALAAAAHVTRLTLVDNRLVTCFLEPRAALAEWDADAGRYTLRAGLQSVHALAASLARILGVALERVRCVSGDVGGGFGSKLQTYPEYAALAWAARRLGRPVKWVSSRTEGFVSDAQSRDHVLAGELALDAAGRITALRVHSTSNLGAYVAPTIPISTLSNMERMVSGLYAIPAIHLRVEGALTNTVPINVYRGVGRIECVYTLERLLERAARETGREPAALRRANMVRTFPHRTATGAVYDSGDYVARLDEALALADTAGFPARRAEAARRGRLRGLGLGPYIEGTGGLPREYAEVRVLPAGVVCASSWATRTGSRRAWGRSPRARCSGRAPRRSRPWTPSSRAVPRWRRISSRPPRPTSSTATAPSASSGPTGRSASSTWRAPRPTERCHGRSARRSRPRGCTRIPRSPSPTAARCASSRSTPRPARSRSSRGPWSTTPAAR